MEALGALNGVVYVIQDAVSYLQKNAWSIVALMVAGYLFKTKIMDPYLKERQHRPQEVRSKDYMDDMRRVRLQQQEEAQRRAVEAAKAKKEHDAKERERKNHIAKKKHEKGGNTLGEASDNSYNPLNPWSSSSGGGGYKATKRTVRRG